MDLNLMKSRTMSRYDETYLKSLKNPEEFWAEAADDIFWHRKWDTVLDNSNPPFYRWFAGGQVNTCYNALDRHVDEHGSGENLALIYDSPITGTSSKYTSVSYTHLTLPTKA